PQQGLYADNEYIRFKRWEWHWSTRVNADGTFPNIVEQKRAYDQLQESQSANRDQTWTNINQTTALSGYHGMGRLTSVAFHPTNPDIFYVGAPIGGIWKTEDGGNTWSAKGDNLPYLSVGNVVVDHTNPEIIYITIGDHSGWWNYGLGVYKSTDGGDTWNPTTHITEFNDEVAYQRMIMNPMDHNEIFVAQTNGIYRTLDGGENWQQIREGHHNDIVFQPGNDSTLYASTDDYWGSSEVYYSNDHGDTWYQLTEFDASYASIHLSVTPANSEYLGIQHSAEGTTSFYLSIDAGTTFETASEMPENGVVFFSPADPSAVYCGWMNVYKSDDFGWTWDQNTNWYDEPGYHEVHADNRFVAHHPITNELYFCNDGGLYKYNEDNDVWTDLSDGLIITQYYRIAVSQQDDIFMIGGTQDNGGRKRIGQTTWSETNGGDAMEVAVNPDDDQIIFTTYINGLLYRSEDQWTDDVYNEITPSQTTGGGWVTPYVIDPLDSDVIVAGYEDVFRSDDLGDSWESISDGLTGDTNYKISAIAVAPSNSDVIYASFDKKIYSTFDGGANWITNNAYLSGSYGSSITSIAVHPTDPMQLWVTVGGYAASNKVRYSSNGGDSFQNWTDNLPNVPVNCMIIDKESPQYDIYIGTDAGVFVRPMNSEEWTYYGIGMPHTSVTDLEIQFETRKLRAATFGRGIWEADLFSEPGVSVNNLTPQTEDWTSISGNPVGDQMTLNFHVSKSHNAQFKIYDIEGRLVKNSDVYLHEGHYQKFFDISDLNAGIYIIYIDGERFSKRGMRVVKG
ncbi:MAG: VPS10 domain-containing protein, partial [Flavobacteriales bacterium]